MPTEIIKHRQHPFAIVKNTYAIIFIIFIYIFNSLIQGRTNLSRDLVGFLLILAVAVVIGLIWSIIKYFNYYWVVTNLNINLYSGILNKKITHIPFANIQSTKKTQDLLMQILGLYGLEIQTSGQGGEKDRVVINVISKKDLDSIQNRINGSEVSVSSPTEIPIYSSDFKSLMTYAIGNIKPIELIVGSFVMFGLIVQISHLISKSFLNDHSALVTSLLTALAIVATIISYLWNTLNQYFGFQLWVKADKVKTVSGLISRSEINVSTSRMQTIFTEQPLFAMWFKLIRLKADLASSSSNEDKQDSPGTITLIPVMKEGHDSLSEIKKAIFNLETPTTKIVRHVTNATLRRINYLFWTQIPLLVVFNIVLQIILKHLATTVLSIILNLIWLVLIILYAWFGTKYNSFQLDSKNSVLYVEQGSGLTKRNFIIPTKYIQSLSQRQSFFMRMRRLGTLIVYVRTGDNSRKLKLRYTKSSDIETLVLKLQKIL
ncbi:MAG: PH domain-containing protein [Lactobacillaceae bacterium]|jgi:putative membrane protein|nr:PH domain-containing protein [Lactobacillaceae bacterium]